MKLKRPLILIVAALAGAGYYQATHGPKSGDSTERSSYSSLTGSGSIMESIKVSKEGGDSVLFRKNEGGIGTVGNPFSRTTWGNHSSSSGSSSSKIAAIPDDLPLLEAAAKGDDAKVEKRIAERVKIDSRDSLRRTPLIYASAIGHAKIIDRLLAAGANIDLEDSEGYSALDYAAGRGLLSTVQLLLERTHTKDDKHYAEYATIIDAALTSDPSRLPGKGKLASINRINPEGQSPLHIAAGNGSVVMVTELIKRGAQVDLANKERRTPLHWAAWNNQAQTLEAMIARGGDPSARDLAGDTPLILAAENNSQDAVRMLLAKHADKEIANKQGKTAALVAQEKGYSDIAQLLK